MKSFKREDKWRRNKAAVGRILIMTVFANEWNAAVEGGN